MRSTMMRHWTVASGELSSVKYRWCRNSGVRSAARALLFHAVVAPVVLVLWAWSAMAQAPSPQGQPVAGPGSGWTKDRPDYIDPLDWTWNDGRWWWTALVGVVAQNYASEIVRFNPDFGKTYFVEAAIGREYAKWTWFRFEWEASAALQFGKETIGDFRIIPAVARFVEFPWNDWIYTTFATGIGASWTTGKSRYETEDGQKTKRLNVGAFFSFTVADPARPDWAVEFRLQHRSPFFGTLNDRGNSMDLLGVGLKHRF